MHLLLRQNYCERVEHDLGAVSGADWERTGYIIANRLAHPLRLWHRGTNEVGAPVGYTVDTFSDDGKWIAEYTSLATFFTNSKKARGDSEHATRQPGGKPHTVYLLSNEDCPEKRLGWVVRRVRRYRKWAHVDMNILDVREIAAFIVDNLLLDDTAVELMSVYMPSIRQFHNEAAFSQLISAPDEAYVKRPELEKTYLDALMKHRHLTLCGISGSGKTALARAVAWAAKAQYQLVIWVDAREIENLESLSAIDVRRNGHQVNVAGLLRERRCLIVLDDLPISIDANFIDKFVTSGSAVLVTRQIQLSKGDIFVESMSEDASKALLTQGIPTPCPPNLLEDIYEAVGGYPLIYRLMNANLREFGYSWADIAADLNAIDRYHDERGLLLTTRLLGRAALSMHSELAFLKLCGTRLIDRDLARAVLKPVGVQNLLKWGIVSSVEPSLLVLHDAIATVLPGIDSPEEDFDDRIAANLCARLETDWQGFLRISSRHNSLLKSRWLDADEPVFLYGYLHGTDEALVEDLILEGVLAVEAVAVVHTLENADLRASVVLEAIEIRYRKEKDAHGIDVAKAGLKNAIGLFHELKVHFESFAEKTTFTIDHHFAKSLLLTGKVDDAELIFERLSNDPIGYPEAKLQLARIFAKSTDETKRESAAALVKSIITEGIAGRVSHSVVLAAVEMYRWKVIRERLPKLLDGTEDTLGSLILQVAAYRPDHAIGTFMTLASNWAFHQPMRFLTIFGALPPPELGSKPRDDKLFAWAEILREASNAYERVSDGKPAPEAKVVLHESFRLLKQMTAPNSYQTRRRAEVLYKLDDIDGALSVLDDQENKHQLDAWGSYWKARCLLKAGRPNDALRHIDLAIEGLGDKQDFLPTFEACRGQIELVLAVELK